MQIWKILWYFLSRHFDFSLFGAELFIGRLAPQTHRVAAEALQHVSPQFLLHKAHHSQPLCSGKIGLVILGFLCTWRWDVSFPQGHCKSFLVFGCHCCCLVTEPGFLLNIRHSRYECMLQDWILVHSYLGSFPLNYDCLDKNMFYNFSQDIDEGHLQLFMRQLPELEKGYWRRDNFLV